MRNRSKVHFTINLFVVAVLFAYLFSATAAAQTTAFSYQGSLKDGANPANGSFQMQFKLFDSLGGAGQIGSTITDVLVTISQGTFAVKLDFGTNALSGANRWLEIAVRRNSGESYVTLSPREQIASAPYSVRTLSAATADMALDSQKLGGVNANQFVQTNDPRLSDARNPLPNSANYIQNQNTAPQASGNFNIAGSGTVASFNVNGPVTFGNVAAPVVAPAGQSRFYFDTTTNKLKVSENGGAFVNLVGASGVSGSGTVNRFPYFSAATTLSDSVISQVSTNIGIGTTNPLAKFHVLSSATVPRVESPNATGFSAGWDFYHGTTGKGYVGVPDTGAPFGSGELMLYGGGNVKTSLWANGTRALTVNADGSIGFGTTTPSSYRYDFFGWTRAFSTSDARLAVETSGTNNMARLFVSSANRNWFLGTTQSFNNDEFYIGEGISGNKMTIANDGTVGIGKRPDPFFRLDATGPIRALSTSSGHFVAETTGGTNSWARYYMRSPSQSWFIGTSQGFNGNQLYIGDETSNQTRFTIQPGGGPIYHQGNVTQDFAGNGLPKALLFVLANGTIVRRYNGITGSTTGGCGFSVSILQVDGPKYTVNIGTDASNRFGFVTSHGWTIAQQSMISGRITSMGAAGITINFFENDADLLTVASDFFLIVY